MTKLTAKSSTIFIATAHRTDVYHSIDEVPPVVRRKLLETTRSVNSATILIADKGGREELMRALQGRSTEVHCRVVENVRPHEHNVIGGPQEPPRRSVRTWIELLLPVVIGASLWLFIGSRF